MKSKLGKPSQPCKACDAARSRAYVAAHREERYLYNRAYRQRPEALGRERERLLARQADPAHRAKERERHREERQRNRARIRGYFRRYEIEHAEKRRAHGAVKYALRTGRMVRPSDCEECFREPEAGKLHAHHDDYSRPLSVKWLCPLCHKAAHAQETVNG
jgi:hypothetical protein